MYNFSDGFFKKTKLTKHDMFISAERVRPERHLKFRIDGDPRKYGI